MTDRHPMMLVSGPTVRWTSRVVLTLTTLAVLVPLAWTVRLAFRTRSAYILDPAGISGTWTLSNIAAAWHAGVATGLGNSLVIVPIGAFAATALSILCGYALAKLRLPGRSLILAILASTFVVPATALAVPLFDEALQFGYVGTRLGLAAVYAGLFTGWGALFASTYFDGLPDELLEAASLDGAGSWRTFWHVGLPLGVPAIVTIFVMNFFMMWSELIIALVMMPSASSQTIASIVASVPSGRNATATVTAAAALIMIVPVLAVFGASQRWLKAEVLNGGVKG